MDGAERAGAATAAATGTLLVCVCRRAQSPRHSTHLHLQPRFPFLAKHGSWSDVGGPARRMMRRAQMHAASFRSIED